MPEEPRRDRRRSRRRRGPPRPQQAPAQPERPPVRGDRAVAPRGERAPAPRDRRGSRRGVRGRQPRTLDEIRPGSPAVILLDARDGEPDRTGTSAIFEGFFDLETGETRRSGLGVPRLRVGEERLWGFECWWRLDPRREGLTDTDRSDLEESKRLLRGLMRDARRASRVPR